jgi:hypothetical protein
MEPYRSEQVGVSWDPNVGADRASILNYEQYNGRIHLLDDSDPNVRFQMAEKVAVKNKATEYRDAITGLHETNVLASAYFSQENVQILQNGLRAGVYDMSNRKIVIPPQNVDNLKVIMRSIYLQYAKHPKETSGVTEEVARLNQYVLDYAVKAVYNEAQGYMNYCRDQSTLAMPMERPQQTDRDFKHLEWKRWT